MMRGWPLSSKKTRTWPSSSVSPIVCRRMTSALPRSISTVTSSPGDHAVEIDRRRQDGDRPVLANGSRELREYLRIHEVGCELVLVDGPADPAPGLGACRVEIRLLEKRAGPCGDGIVALQGLVLEGLRPAADGLPEISVQHLDHRSGEGEIALGIEHVGGRQALRDHHQGHVADDLRGGRHLDDVAEQVVGRAVGLGDLVPARFQAKGSGLLLEVGELAARHLVQIDLRSARLKVALESRILCSHGLPVERDLADRLRVEAGVAIRVAQGLDDRAQAGLRRGPRHRVHAGVDRVDTGVDRGQHGGASNARGVVGVQVDRQPDLLLQGSDEGAGLDRLEEAGHVLDRQDVAARRLELPGGADVVSEVVFAACRVEDVAGVADRAFGELARLQHGIDRDAHVLDPIEAVEDPEQVHARLRRAAHEVADDIVRVVGVADAVGAAQQHLRQEVGDALADQCEPLPGVLVEEAHGDVEGGAAPAFEREELRQGRANRRGRRRRCRRCACGSPAATDARRAWWCR